MLSKVLGSMCNIVSKSMSHEHCHVCKTVDAKTKVLKGVEVSWYCKWAASQAETVGNRSKWERHILPLWSLPFWWVYIPTLSKSNKKRLENYSWGTLQAVLQQCTGKLVTVLIQQKWPPTWKVVRSVHEQLLSIDCPLLYECRVWIVCENNHVIQFRPLFLGGFGVIISQQIDGSIWSWRHW